MARKHEIKVYLPERLVGELEGRKRLGTRSKFIENAINNYLRKQENFSPYDCTLIHILCVARDKFGEEGLTTFKNIIQAIIEDVNR
jgi:metal-responsive CopG/Arc/MetJ family transcriptional regulator